MGTYRMNGSSCTNLETFLQSGWGTMRLSAWLTLFIILFHFFDQTTLVGGFPLEEEISEAAAMAAIRMNSGSSSRHHGAGVSRSMRMEEGAESLDESSSEKMDTTLPRLSAMDLLFQKAAAAAAARTAAEEELEMRREEDVEEESGTAKGRSLWMDDFHKKASQLCRTSASLQCGKRILILAEDEKNLSVHVKCDLRDDFLKCIDREKNNCLELAQSSILPELPSKEMIKVEQSKLWNVLWTAGGCILAN